MPSSKTHLTSALASKTSLKKHLDHYEVLARSLPPGLDDECVNEIIFEYLYMNALCTIKFTIFPNVTNISDVPTILSEMFSQLNKYEKEED